MIPRKRRICAGCNTPQYIFSNNLCSNCYSRRRAEVAHFKVKWGQSTPSTRKSSQGSLKGLKRRTDKRAAQEKEYDRRMKVIEAETPKKQCFFCGERIEGLWDRHHLMGREGELVFNTDYIVFVHRKCHMRYHDESVDTLEWFPQYLKRLKPWDEMFWNRESNKLNK